MLKKFLFFEIEKRLTKASELLCTLSNVIYVIKITMFLLEQLHWKEPTTGFREKLHKGFLSKKRITLPQKYYYARVRLKIKRLKY